MLKKILVFLFGTGANIFNEKGEVSHDLPKEFWDSWHDRYYCKDTADWRNHKGGFVNKNTTNAKK